MAPTTDVRTSPNHAIGGGGPRHAPVESARLDIDPAIIGSWHRPLRILSAPLRRRWLDVVFDGEGNVPVDGPAILAANHLSFIDSPLLMTGLDRPVVFLGKAEYMVNPVARHLFPRLGMIPVDRSGRGVSGALTRAGDVLRDGGLLGIFPEGTRSRDGRLGCGQLGAAHLALTTGAPIVPLGIVGSDAAMPVGQRVPSRGRRIVVRVGAPIDLGPYRALPRTRRTKRALTDEVMASIAQLSGQSVAVESADRSV